MNRLTGSLAIALVLATLVGCSGMTTREKNAAIGAAVGGVAGSVLTDSTAGTLGGAAIGGVIGSQIKK